MTFAEVMLWDRKIGTVALPDDGNIATFRYDRDFLGSGIELSPAYDLTLSYNPENRWLKAHQMSVNGRRADITEDDILSCAAVMDISRSKCRTMLERIKSAVSEFPHFAEQAHLTDTAAANVQKLIST